MGILECTNTSAQLKSCIIQDGAVLQGKCIARYASMLALKQTTHCSAASVQAVKHQTNSLPDQTCLICYLLFFLSNVLNMLFIVFLPFRTDSLELNFEQAAVGIEASPPASTDVFATPSTSPTLPNTRFCNPPAAGHISQAALPACTWHSLKLQLHTAGLGVHEMRVQAHLILSSKPKFGGFISGG
jgi:hypothetical protein